MELLESLGPDVFRLLDAVSIARSRRQIERFYTREIDTSAGFRDTRRRTTAILPPTLRGNCHTIIWPSRSTISACLSTSRRSTSSTRTASENWKRRGRSRTSNQADRRGFDRDDPHQLPKALGEFAKSLTLTLERTVKKIDNLIGAY